MRRIILAAPLAISLGGCQSTIEPVKTMEPSAIRSGPAPIGELPEIPRAEIAALVERDWTAGTGLGKKLSPPVLNAGVAQFARRRGGIEATAYCVWADIKAWGYTYTRWWILDVFITDRGIPLVHLDSHADSQPGECPAKEASQPLPELIAARAVRRQEGGAAPVAAVSKTQPVTSHTPVTISAPTDGRGGQ
jgi:hypothetical protein